MNIQSCGMYVSFYINAKIFVCEHVLRYMTYLFDKPAGLPVLVAMANSDLVQVTEISSNVDLELVSLTLLEEHFADVIRHGLLELQLL